ncbi:MAG: ion channel [Spirosomataceae bacterium]
MAKDTLVEREKSRQDLGFGTKLTERSTRLINKDGLFNVRRKGQSFEAWLNAYHRLIVMSWRKFVFLIFVYYTFLNLLFAGIYYLIGIEHLTGIDTSTAHAQFWDAFFFSSQTLTTVGYGRIAPTGFLMSFVAAIESLIGLTTFAIITGLVYGRFSRPNPKIRFSKNIIVAPYLDTNGLMFRMVNERSNQLINVTVSLLMSRIEERNGHPYRRYYALDLERNKVTFFPTNWTIVHPITKESPLFGETAETMKASDTEFLIALEGTDDTFADAVYTRTSYLHNELVFGAKFKQMLETDEIGNTYVLDLDLVDDFERVGLNQPA